MNQGLYTHNQKRITVIVILLLASAALVNFNIAGWLSWKFGILTSQRILGVLVFVIFLLAVKRRLGI